MQNLTRRSMLNTLAAGAVSVTLANFGKPSAFAQDAPANQTANSSADQPANRLTPAGKPIYGDPRVRGPFPILSTPFKENGDVDYEVLGKQAQFVDWCGSPGMIWPQSGDSVDLLTMDEKLKGMEVLADAMKGRKSALCLGVQGKNADEMLVYARKAEELNVPCIISRPPDDGKTQEDMRDYWHELMKVVNRPVIIQTTGGTKYQGPAPSVPLLIELAKENPYFGYVKEEAENTWQRMKELVAAKPTIKCVMSAWGAWGWLHQSLIGTEGLVTERAAYADILAKIWENMDCGNRVKAAEYYSQLLLMLNLKETIPCNQLRGFHLYVFMLRGVFKNTLSREYGPKNAIPEKPIIREMNLPDEWKAEIEMRLEAIKPYLKEGKFA